MPATSIYGNNYVFSQDEDGTWHHNHGYELVVAALRQTSPPAGLARADEIAWALNSGIMDSCDLSMVNKSLAKGTVKVRHRGSLPYYAILNRLGTRPQEPLSSAWVGCLINNYGRRDSWPFCDEGHMQRLVAMLDDERRPLETAVSTTASALQQIAATGPSDDRNTLDKAPAVQSRSKKAKAALRRGELLLGLAAAPYIETRRMLDEQFIEAALEPLRTAYPQQDRLSLRASRFLDDSRGDHVTDYTKRLVCIPFGYERRYPNHGQWPDLRSKAFEVLKEMAFQAFDGTGSILGWKLLYHALVPFRYADFPLKDFSELTLRAANDMVQAGQDPKPSSGLRGRVYELLASTAKSRNWRTAPAEVQQEARDSEHLIHEAMKCIDTGLQPKEMLSQAPLG